MPTFTPRESLTQELNELFTEVYTHLQAIENTVALTADKQTPDAPEDTVTTTADTTIATTPSTDATGTDASANTATV